MPRIARKNMETSFFHIMVQGINKSYIFKNKNDKNKYISNINKYQLQNNVQVISYCIMDNHAHILVHTDQIENMSNFMHLVNSSYSNYYNKTNFRTGYVFRDRYKSEPIYKEKYLLNCINYIHMNPVKAGIVKKAEQYAYSSCKEFVNNTGVCKSKIVQEIIETENYKYVLNNTTDMMCFMDIDINQEERNALLIQEYQRNKKETLENIMRDIAKALKISRKQLYRLKSDTK